MKDIINITSSQFDDKRINTVNARELHAYLESKQKFADWIKGRIAKFGFEENLDFCIINLGSKGQGGHNAIDYHISIDMAKELSMVENNEQGRQARRYFIECEKRSRLDKPLLDFENPAQLRHMLLETLDKQIAMQEEIKELTPQAEAYQLIAVEAEGALCITNSAKNLQVKPKILFDWLSYNKWIYRRVGGSGWVTSKEDAPL